MKLKMYMRGLGIGIMVTALIMGIATKDGRPLTDAEIKAAAAKLGMVDSSEMKLTDLPQKNGGESTPPDTVAGADGQESGAEGPSDPGANPEGEESPSGEGASPGGAEEPSAPGANPEGEESSSGEGASPGGAEEPSDPGANPEGEAASSGEGASADEVGNGDEPEAEAPPAASASPDAEDSGDTVKITVARGAGSRSVCNQLAEAGLIEDAAAFDQYLIDSGYSKRISAGTFEIPRNASDEEIAKIISKSR